MLYELNRLDILFISTISNIYQYFKYLQSFSGCSTVINWIVFNEQLSVAQAQMDSMRTLTNLDGNSLAGNYRPTQALSGRQVTRWE